MQPRRRGSLADRIRGRDCRRDSLEEDVLSTPTPAAGDKTAAVSAAVTDVTAETASEAFLARILASLEDDKAEEIVTIDLRGRSSVADHLVVCSGRSSRQVSAIADHLVERLKEEFGRPARIEGKEQGDWVLVDAGDVIVHVFRPEVRDFYQLEKMWLPSAATPG